MNALALSFDHIPDAEVETDIADTQQEIAVLERELRLLRSVVEAKELGIRERREFIAMLHDLLAVRRGEA